MKANFDKSLKFVLGSEGGYVFHQSDRGGPTNQGVALKTLWQYHADFDYGDMDGDGDVDIEDIKLLDTPEEAAPIYRKWFWDAVQGDDLPSGIDYVVFDSAVNHGPKNAGIFLQRAANRRGEKLDVDGDIGPITIKVVRGQNPRRIITDILCERDIFYRKIIARDATQECFMRGWQNRLAEVAVNVREFS